MIKRPLDSAFLVVLGVALFALLAVILLPFFSDWVVDIWGEKKERVVEIVGWGIVWILVLWGEVKGGIWMAARSKSTDAQNGNMKKKKTIGRKVKASRRWVRVLWRWMKAVWQKRTVLWQRVKGWGRWIWQNPLDAFLWLVGFIGIVVFAVLFLIMFNKCVECWAREILGVDNKKDAIQSVGLGFAGVLAIFGAIAVNRRANAQVKDNKLVERGHIQERFKTAVEHLGSKEVAVRIASFYEFSYLARNNKDLQKNILDILYAHLRRTTTDKEYKKEVEFTNEGDSSEVRPTEEVQSLLGVLFQSKDGLRRLVLTKAYPDLRRVFLMRADLREMDLQYVRLFMADLRDANLRKADLYNANLQSTNLQKAILEYANLRGAYLYNTKLQHTKLKGVNLQDANLRGADLQGADLEGADLQGANLYKADLRHTDLQNTDLRGTDLRHADLRDAYLWGADLEGADLRDADLRDADLEDVRNLEMANLSRAKIKGAEFPKEYVLPDDVIYDDDDNNNDDSIDIPF